MGAVPERSRQALTARIGVDNRFPPQPALGQRQWLPASQAQLRSRLVLPSNYMS